MKIAIFKLLEFISSIFSQSHQLKDINIISLTKGFDLKINIFESISKNKSYEINYIGNLSFVSICLIKNKIPIGLGQIQILNQKQKQNIKIFPTNNNQNKKIINLVLICYNKKSFSEKYIESYRSPYKTTYYSNFNNYNTNNTSSISISSLIISPHKHKTPNMKNKYQKKKGQRNKSQTNIKGNFSEDRQLFINLSKNSLCSLNNNKNLKYKDLEKNISVYSNENSRRQLSGSISCYSNNFSEKREKHKKIISSPIIYSFPYEKDNINRKINTNTNRKINIKNKSMIEKLIIPKIDLEINNRLRINNKFITQKNIDTINKQIEDYIIDKSFENILQNDMPIISQEDKQFLYYDDFNMTKFDKIVEDILLLYKDRENILNKINDNDIKLEILFLIEKVYEIMEEYYKEYHNFNNQNKSLINIIKYYGYKYNNLLKMENKIKIRINKNKIKSDLNNNKNKCYISNIIKINNELKILNNINKSKIKRIDIKNNKKNELKDLLSHIIQKNENKINDEQKNKLKKIGKNINSDNKKYDKNKKNDLFLSNSNKKMIYNKNKKNNIHHKRKNSIETPTNKKIVFFNSNLKDKYRVFGNNILKIKVKSKINNNKK